MKAIRIRFEDAKLFFPAGSDIPKNWVYQPSEGKYVHKRTSSPNFNNPITSNIVANVLRVLCGDIPVPTLKPNDIGNNEIFDELARNAYVKYDTELIDRKKSTKPVFTECMQTNKSHVPNSHSKIVDEFVLYDGSVITVAGKYNWSYFDKTFTNEKYINVQNLTSFISDVIGENDVRQFTFKELVCKMSKFWHDEEYKSKLKTFFDEHYHHNAMLSSWQYVLFGWVYDSRTKSLQEFNTGSNCNYKTKTPLLFTRGVSKIMNISGTIICPVSNEVITSVTNNCGTSTILDGGLAYILGCEFFDETYLELDGFSKILSRENAISNCTSSN